MIHPARLGAPAAPEPLHATTEALLAAHRCAELGAFWWLADDRALERAAALERGEGEGTVSALCGLPFAVKDSFDLAGTPTTGGLRGVHRPASADAAAVQRLEHAGAVAIGKTAMDPLAWTTHGQAPGFPPCLNPIDRTLSPGGSSSGSAVAVAAGIVPFAIGSDTAGSIRIPAAYCGAVGLKPALGAVPLDGCLPLSPFCDTAGVVARTVADCALAYDALTTVAGGAVSAARSTGALGRVGVLSDLFAASEPEVATVCEAALPELERQGCRLEQVALEWSAPELGLLMAVEFAAAWGARADAEPTSFPPAMLAAFDRARSIPATRYEEARREFVRARERLGRQLGRFSALVSPTVPIPVPPLEDEDVAVSTRFTRIFSALGWPALSVPCGRDTRGAPVGLHVASARSLNAAVAVAAAVEKASDRR